MRSTFSPQALSGDRAEAHAVGDECRCLCGNLLARVVGDRVELKCRRCKRTHLIPIAREHRKAPAEPKLAPLRKAGAT